MRFDLNLREKVRSQFRDIAREMQGWQVRSRLLDDEIDRARSQICLFGHTTVRDRLSVGGVDGSGDFPMLSYADSFIYLALAQATVYEANRITGLWEQGPAPEIVFETAWLPESSEEAPEVLDRFHERLAGMSLVDVVEASDYRMLKAKEMRKSLSVQTLLNNLVRPHASDTGNLAIQLRSTAELGAALRLIQSEACPDYLLMDTTFSLPLLSSSSSLFYEHVKRLCCVEALRQGKGFFALSKSHGLPAMDSLEELARDRRGLEGNQVAEHWYLRIPEVGREGWTLSLCEGRRLPPAGAVSYLVRFHRSTPVLRLDMDVNYWERFVKGGTDEETIARERRIFEDLDYACHDQRVYGYPYPIKAAHDRASLMQSERVAMRKQLIAEAVSAGMSPSLFRDPSLATGHR